MKKAVLFDLDGVLVSSMAFHFEAWSYAFKKHNIPVTRHTLALGEGFRSADMAREIARTAGMELTHAAIDAIVLDKRAYYLTIANVAFYPGAIAVVQKLKEWGMQIAIVTSCVRNSLQRAIPTAEIGNFDYIITGDEIKNGKPHPDPFLVARDKLGLKSETCVVVENAPLGIKAAKTAGMVCLAITTTLGAEDLQEADYIVNEIQEILPIIEKLE
jgi:beta-phosphoglucomutase